MTFRELSMWIDIIYEQYEWNNYKLARLMVDELLGELAE